METLRLKPFFWPLSDTHVSVSKAFSHNDRLLGVVGVDISFFYLAEEVIHYDYSSDSYAFLLDANSGKLLYHPIFTHNNRFNSKRQNKYNSFFNYDYYFQNSFTNVEHVEQASEFYPVVKSRMLAEPTGSHTIKLSFPFHDSANNESYFHFLNDRWHIYNQYSTITYYWRRVSFTPYIIVVAVFGNQYLDKPLFNGEFHLVKKINFVPEENFHPEYISHRLDYSAHSANTKLCKHFNQLATTGKYCHLSWFINR